MATKQEYGLKIFKNNKTCLLAVTANDSNHAQAQGNDILRALSADRFLLTYDKTKQDAVSELFKKLAFNAFNHQNCELWEKPRTNGNPCFYVLGQRFYVRKTILNYLNIPLDNTVKQTCNCNYCINPYHFKYVPKRNSKLTGGDLKLLLAYRSQGTGISQAAKALNVHRSTIYRNLKNECFSLGSSCHGISPD